MDIRNSIVNKIINENRRENGNKNKMRMKMINKLNNEKKFKYIYNFINDNIINKHWSVENNRHLDIFSKKQRYNFIKTFYHKSFFNFENDNEIKYFYERLEYIGDSLLNYLVKRWIFHNFNYQEGILSKISSYMISNKFYVKLFDKLQFTNLVKLGKGVELTDNIKEDVIEGFIYSFYVNFGMKYTKCFVNKLLSDENKSDILNKSFDNLSILNNYFMDKYKKNIKEVLNWKVKQGRDKKWICLGYSINGTFHKNRRFIKCNSFKELKETLSKDILELDYNGFIKNNNNNYQRNYKRNNNNNYQRNNNKNYQRNNNNNNNYNKNYNNNKRYNNNKKW